MRHCVYKLLVVISLMLCASPLWAEDGHEGLRLSEAPINRSDMASIKRGAKFFATNCMSCHTMVYLRYDKIAQEAGVTYDKMPLNVKSWPNGVTPPDLSLEADSRGVDWIYTYLHSFYQDSARPTGANNLLVPNSSMPNIIGPYQGDQVLADHVVPDLLGHVRWYDLVKLTKQGTMTPEQFDETVADVVNFLAYAAEPFHTEQRQIGFWVLGFLAILLVLMYLLKHEYWKDVKKRREE
jgi:ubiquinol-cytochrome c reductase cytochrome c1 subunit